MAMPAATRSPITLTRRTRALTPYVYLLPALALYALFFLRPFAELVRFSFLDWDGVGKASSAGLSNYRTLLGGDDPIFWQAFRHNIVWMAAGVVVPTLVGLGFAIAITRGPLHGRTVFRTLLFLPQVLSSVVVAIVWGWIYNPNGGALNELLGHIGLSTFERPWLGDSTLVLGALFAVWAWVAYGFSMVVFIAALQNIDEDLFSAAKVDGSSLLNQFRHVLIPSIRRPLTVVMLINAISAFQVFDLVFIMTNGGPFNSSQVLTLYMYDNAFLFSKVGYASAVAVVLGVVIVAVSLIFLRIRRLDATDA